MDAASVLKQKRDSAAASGDIARLQGKRLVVVSEIEKGNRLQESFMKQASGNDSLVARGLYQSKREFRPTHHFRVEYEDWCRDEGEDPSPGRNFNKMMKERGFDQKSTRFEEGVVKAWHGIRLKDPSRQHYTSLMSHIKKEPAKAGIRGKPAMKAKTIGDILDEAEPLFDFAEDEFAAVG